MKKKFLTQACLVSFAITSYAQNKKIPPPPPPQLPKVEMKKFAPPVINKEVKDFFERNLTIARNGWTNVHLIVLYLKNNSKEKYNLSYKNEKKIFMNK